jgi:hypothetical protein
MAGLPKVYRASDILAAVEKQAAEVEARAAKFVAKAIADLQGGAAVSAVFAGGVPIAKEQYRGAELRMAAAFLARPSQSFPTTRDKLGCLKDRGERMQSDAVERSCQPLNFSTNPLSTLLEQADDAGKYVAWVGSRFGGNGLLSQVEEWLAGEIVEDA